jgi:hypothetical protein
VVLAYTWGEQPATQILEDALRCTTGSGPLPKSSLCHMHPASWLPTQGILQVLKYMVPWSVLPVPLLIL